MSIGETIKRIRAAIGMTQVEFAKAIGAGQSSISDYEKGLAIPSLKVAQKIVKVAKENKVKVKFSDLFPDD